MSPQRTRKNESKVRTQLLLITTSRRTSNRVRSFVRDLSFVFPGSERFNRGSMSMAELKARLKQSDADAALVVTTYRGNPGRLRIYFSDDDTAIVQLSGCVLRREVLPDSDVRVNKIVRLSVSSKPSELTKNMADLLKRMTGMDWVEESAVYPLGPEHSNNTILRLQDAASGMTVWTYYHALDAVEIGPRMTVSALRGK